MSAVDPLLEAWGEAITAELSAEVLEKRGVRGYLSWFLEQRARKESAHGIDHEAVGTPVSVKHRARVAATYARVAACLGARDPADEERGEYLAFSEESGNAAREVELRLETLRVFYASGLDSGDGNYPRAWVAFSDRMGIDPAVVAGMANYAERVIRRRMIARGLLPDPQALPSPDSCPPCRGSGTKGSRQCSACSGSGRVAGPDYSWFKEP